MSSPTPAARQLHVEDLVVAHGRRTDPVLHHVDASVRPGEIVGVIGPNGSGKSTLAKSIVGILTPRSGRVVVDGQDLSTLRPRRRARLIGYVPQQDSVTASALTVGESIALGLPDRVGDDRTDRVLRVAHELGLDGLILRRSAELSGGQRQRVLIGRALARAAPYVVLDEPVNSLDVQYQTELMEILVRLADAGTGVMVVLHDLNLAALYCDRLLVLTAGRVERTGPPSEVLTEDLVHRVYRTPLTVTDVDGTRFVVPRREPRSLP